MSHHHHRRFYLPPEALEQERFAISHQELHHLKVRRLKIGDTILAVDGVGNEYRSEIIFHSREFAICQILDKKYSPPPKWKITMGLGIIRPTQMAWACEKSAELGCWDIIPVVCKNSQRMISPSEIERLNRVTLSAMKQSGTLYHTRVLSPLPLKDLLAEFTAKAEIFFADPTGFSTQRILNFSLSTTANQLLFLVGPEGGFTAEEIEYFQEVKGSAVSLGENRLRSETAAVVGIAFLMAKVSK